MKDEIIVDDQSQNIGEIFKKVQKKRDGRKITWDKSTRKIIMKYKNTHISRL